ncbi:hypothetical protein [Pseudothauera rhizosphaerae]|uniref:HTH cro/C1-type domain-containing protein n=1 Tax=Pseudothauera rhizosphaerae TaxID=2565932 RepID=A0A4S4AQY6_9RHOO|nr:hypothetical protein [Pseudothauera rhizosphaerae]THF62189.1 hypothetical protein E6O51_08540 [Pseudothauera rhizosphaerae]
MSTDLVEQINLRLREEIARAGLTLAAAARAAGEASPQRMKDVAAGKQRCPIDLLARLDGTGIDVLYVLTGRRGPGNRPISATFSADEDILIDTFRATTPAGRTALTSVARALQEAGNPTRT